MKVFPKIIASRFVLDRIKEEEIPALIEIFEDTQTRRFLPEIYELIDIPDGVRTFISTFEHYLDNDQGVLWGIYKNEVVIGFVAVMDLHEHPTLFYAMHPKMRSQGYMKASVSYIIDFLRKNRCCQMISTDVHKDNYVSQNILKNLGFVIQEEDEIKSYGRLL